MKINESESSLVLVVLGEKWRKMKKKRVLREVADATLPQPRPHTLIKAYHVASCAALVAHAPDSNFFIFNFLKREESLSKGSFKVTSLALLKLEFIFSMISYC